METAMWSISLVGINCLQWCLGNWAIERVRDLIVAFEAHRTKQYHLGLGRKPIAKTTFASANQNRDYRIFEDFAFYIMEQARKKRVTDIFKLQGNVYAFDSTTIPLC